MGAACCADGGHDTVEVAQEPAAAEPVATDEITVTLKKDGDSKLGLDISHTPDKTALKVKNVKDGLVKAWNEANPDRAIEKDDLIIVINGVKDNSDEMLKEVKKDDIVIVVKKGGAKPAS